MCQTITKKDVEDFLRAKNLSDATIQYTFSEMQMLDRIGIRSKEEIEDKYRNYTARYRYQLRRALDFTNEMMRGKQ